MPGLLFFVIYLIWWIIKRKPYHRHIVYRFPLCSFSVRVRRW